MSTFPSPVQRNTCAGPSCCTSSRSRDLAHRVLRICLMVSLLAAGIVLWLFGLTVWTVLVIALLIACPIAVAWMLLAGRTGRPKLPGGGK